MTGESRQTRKSEGGIAGLVLGALLALAFNFFQAGGPARLAQDTTSYVITAHAAPAKPAPAPAAGEEASEVARVSRDGSSACGKAQAPRAHPRPALSKS